MSLELYRKGHHVNQRSGEWCVRIAGQARITFAKPCTKWLLERGQFIEMLWDSEIKSIAIRPVKERTPHAYSIQGARYSQCTITVKGFLKHIGSPPDGVYGAKADAENGYLVIDLAAQGEETSLVAGDRLSCSIANFEHRCNVVIEQEQAKPLPDNALIALLCDAVRLGREYTRVAIDLTIGNANAPDAAKEE